MKTLKEVQAGKGGSTNPKNAADAHPQSHPDNCRCKEVSEKTPGELLKLMWDDLAFWKKGKKESDKS